MIRMKRWGLFAFILIIASFFILPLDAYARQWALGRDMIKYGPARLRPSFSMETGYNNNINLTSTNTTGSFVGRFTPGVTLAVPLGKLYLETGADFCYVNVAEGSVSPWLNAIRAVARYNFNNHTALGAQYNFSPMQLYGVGTGNTADLHDLNMVLSHEFSERLSMKVEGDWEKFYTNIKSGSMSYPNADYDSWDGKLGFGYKLTPLTSLGLQGVLTSREYKNASSKSYNAASGTLSISQKLTPRINVGASGGVEHRDYRSWGSADAMTWGASCDAILTPFSTLRVTYDHSIGDTFYPVDKEVLKNPFAVDDSLLNLLAVDFRYVTTDHVGINSALRLTDKDTVDFDSAYIRSESGQGLGALNMPYEYPEALVEHNYYFGVGYSRGLTSWCSLGGKLSYGVRSSTIQNKYDYYAVNGGLNISF